MKKYEEIKFKLGELKGISAKSIEEHLKLYGAYVKNTNLVLEKIEELSVDQEKNAYLLAELHRRFAFEFGGMRNHEYYFHALEKEAKSLSSESELAKAITQSFGSFENWFSKFKNLALTRGIGWAMLSYEKKSGQLLNHWVDEQHLGQLVSTSPILALDMWEHAYFLDYTPAEKKKYIEAFFENLNWTAIEGNFKKAI